MSESAIEASSLSFGYRRRGAGEEGRLRRALPTLRQPELALRELSLRIPRGSIYGLLGPNGAGKSTFLGLALVLEKRSSSLRPPITSRSEGASATCPRSPTSTPS